MKGTLTFELPEEEDDFRDAQNGSLFRDVIGELQNYLRNARKYNDKKSINIEELESHIIDLLTERHLLE